MIDFCSKIALVFASPAWAVRLEKHVYGMEVLEAPAGDDPLADVTQ